MAVAINKLTNGNVYIDGTSHLGKIAEMEMPELKGIMADHSAIGMLGKIEFFSGFDKMTARIKWNSFYKDALLKVADLTKALKLQVRSSLESYDSNGRSAQLPVVVYLTASSNNLALGMVKQHENLDSDTNLSVYYVKMEIDGQPVIEFDAIANVYKVNGQDIAATYRANLGI